MSNCPSNLIHQGDDFPLEIELTALDGTLITPSVATNVSVQIGEVVQEYPNGNLTYQNGFWIFPLKSAQTSLMKEQVPFQVGAMISGAWLHTDKTMINIGSTLKKIRGVPNG